MTAAEITLSTWEYCAHYNMGAKGYGYGHRCVEFPRLSMIDRYYKPSKEHPDGLMQREWRVDGDVVATARALDWSVAPDAALAALAIAPKLTDDEVRILDLVPWDYVEIRGLETELAGVDRPSGGIMPNTPHSRVMTWLGQLHDKGMIEYGKRELPDDGRTRGFPFEHMNYEAVVRRRKQEPTKGETHGEKTT